MRTVAFWSQRPQQPNAGVWAIFEIVPFSSDISTSATYGVLHDEDGRFKTIPCVTLPGRANMLNTILRKSDEMIQFYYAGAAKRKMRQIRSVLHAGKKVKKG